MKYLYEYPQRDFPYLDLVQTNGRRGRNDLEYGLLDTGIFDDDRRSRRMERRTLSSHRTRTLGTLFPRTAMA